MILPHDSTASGPGNFKRHKPRSIFLHLDVPCSKPEAVTHVTFECAPQHGTQQSRLEVWANCLSIATTDLCLETDLLRAAQYPQTTGCLTIIIIQNQNQNQSRYRHTDNQKHEQQR